jgi:hypothetical protein
MATQSGLVSESECYDLQVFRGSRIPTIWLGAGWLPISKRRSGGTRVRCLFFAGERGGAPHGAGVLAAPDLCGPAPLGLGPAPHRWRDRPPARDRLAHIAERGSRGSLVCRARQRDATSGPAPATSLHIDSKRFTRFSHPGHAVTGIRDRTGAEKRMRIGHEFVHAIVDDHSRLA